MNDHTADHQILRARSGQQEAEVSLTSEMITEMAQQVIEFADDSRHEGERENYLRMARNWLLFAADLEAQSAQA